MQWFIQHLSKSIRSFFVYQTAYFKCFPFSSCSLFTREAPFSCAFPASALKKYSPTQGTGRGTTNSLYKEKKSGCSPNPSYCIQKATSGEHLLGCLIHSGQAVVAQWTLYMMQGHTRREFHATVLSNVGCRSAKTITNHQGFFLSVKTLKSIKTSNVPQALKRTSKIQAYFSSSKESAAQC